MRVLEILEYVAAGLIMAGIVLGLLNIAIEQAVYIQEHYIKGQPIEYRITEQDREIYYAKVAKVPGQ